MTRGTPDEARLVDYLLGQASPEVQAEIEERYVSDPAFLDELNAVERDLIDRYVSGELADRAAFETHFLASPARREKLEVARAWLQSPTAVSTDAGPSRYPMWALAAAASVVLAVGGWLLVSTRQPQAPQSVGPTAGAPDRPVQPPVTPGPPDTVPPARPADVHPVVALVLAPTLTRDAGVIPAVAVPPNTDVQLLLGVEAGGHESYRVVIRTADGTEAWRQDRLKSALRNAVPTVVVTISRDRLSNDDYTVTLSGITARGGIEEIGGYYFRVQLRQ